MRAVSGKSWPLLQTRHKGHGSYLLECWVATVTNLSRTKIFTNCNEFLSNLCTYNFKNFAYVLSLCKVWQPEVGYREGLMSYCPDGRFVPQWLRLYKLMTLKIVPVIHSSPIYVTFGDDDDDDGPPTEKRYLNTSKALLNHNNYCLVACLRA